LCGPQGLTTEQYVDYVGEYLDKALANPEKDITKEMKQRKL